MSTNVFNQIKHAVAGIFSNDEKADTRRDATQEQPLINSSLPVNPALDGSPTIMRGQRSPVMRQRQGQLSKDSGVLRQVRTVIADGIDTIKEGAKNASERLGLIEQASPTLHEVPEDRKVLKRMASPTPVMLDDLVEEPFIEGRTRKAVKFDVIISDAITSVPPVLKRQKVIVSSLKPVESKFLATRMMRPAVLKARVLGDKMSFEQKKMEHEKLGFFRMPLKFDVLLERLSAIVRPMLPERKQRKLTVRSLAPIENEFLVKRMAPLKGIKWMPLKAQKAATEAKASSFAEQMKFEVILGKIRSLIRPMLPAPKDRSLKLWSLRPLDNKFLESRRQSLRLMKAKKIDIVSVKASRPQTPDFASMKLPIVFTVPIERSYGKRPVLGERKGLKLWSLRPLDNKFLEARRQPLRLLKAKKIDIASVKASRSYTKEEFMKTE